MTKFRTYIIIPIVSTIILFITTLLVMVVAKNDKASLIVFTGSMIYLAAISIAGVLIYGRLKRDIFNASIGMQATMEQVISYLEIPYAIMDTRGNVAWANYEMRDMLDDVKHASNSMVDLIPNITKMKLPTRTEDVVFHTKIGEKNVKVLLSAMESEEFDDMLRVVKSVDGDKSQTYISVYIYDETEIEVLRQENYNQQMIIGLLYIDNYDEVLDVVDEVKRSLLSALVDRKINKYMTHMNAVIKKLEKDKYLFVFQKKYLEEVKVTIKELLEEVKKINSGKTESDITLSVGLGIATADYLASYEYARAAIDLALGRGGDQVVIKNGDDISYIGGKSASIEKSTRVTARVKAHALRELLEAHENILIMGHSIGDVDSLGSAIGVYKIAQILGRSAHIVINEINASIRPMINCFLGNPDYPEDLFVGNMQAQELSTKDTLLVVVDVNRPSHTECPDLFDLIPTVIVLDHHRVQSDSVKHAVLSYIEPSASSASELVAEVLQYIGGDLKLRPLEAEALYSGIMVDTNNFLTKAGVHTFEAAAYLRKNGADVTKIRKMFREDMHEHLTKAYAVSSMEVFMDGYAFTSFSSEGLESPTLQAAQVANELLEIVGIKASFVFTEFKNKIYVSARSIDEANVQVIMEKLGGGGHLNIAGAQVENATIAQVIDRVKSILLEMHEGGEL